MVPEPHWRPIALRRARRRARNWSPAPPVPAAGDGSASGLTATWTGGDRGAAPARLPCHRPRTAGSPPRQLAPRAGRPSHCGRDLTQNFRIWAAGARPWTWPSAAPNERLCDETWGPQSARCVRGALKCREVASPGRQRVQGAAWWRCGVSAVRIGVHGGPGRSGPRPARISRSCCADPRWAPSGPQAWISSSIQPSALAARVCACRSTQGDDALARF